MTRSAADNCRGCGAPVVWLKTKRGKNILVEPKRLDGGKAIDDANAGRLFDRDRHDVHWQACPNAAQFRKPR